MAVPKNILSLIYNVLAEDFINAIEENKLSINEQKKISSLILENISKDKTENEIMKFLETLASDYPFFSKSIETIKVAVIEKTERKNPKENPKEKEVLKKLQITLRKYESRK